MTDLKGKHFLNIVNFNLEPIVPTYIKGDPWLKYIDFSNSLCARVMKTITNHTPISKYHMRFFPNQDFSCPYSRYPIESK